MAAYTTIDDPSSVFQCKLYTGNGTAIASGGQAITLDGSENMQPDLVWIKNRSATGNHIITDAVRGVQLMMMSANTDAETNLTQGLTSFNSNGFTVGSLAEVNTSSNNFVSWNFKETAGVFDIVTYTGNGSNRTISHNLGAVPTMMVTKVRSTTNQWLVYHKSMGNTETMKWDDTSAATTQSNLWNSTTPTSSVFSVGTHTGSNLDGGTFVMYLFGDKQGVSKTGSYIGNGNDGNGPFIFTGFKPAFCMVKRTTAGENWLILDNKRDSFNPQDSSLYPNLSNAEDADGADYFDFYSNGMKVKTNNGGTNTSGASYIFMAFAEQPFVTSTGVPATAR